MSDDKAIDDLLRSAMTAAPPQPSPAFHATVMQRVSRRRLPASSKAVLGGYAAASLLLSAWLMQGVPLLLAVGGLGAGAVAAATAGFYVSRLARERH